MIYIVNTVDIPYSLTDGNTLNIIIPKTASSVMLESIYHDDEVGEERMEVAEGGQFDANVGHAVLAVLGHLPPQFFPPVAGVTFRVAVIR